MILKNYQEIPGFMNVNAVVTIGVIKAFVDENLNVTNLLDMCVELVSIQQFAA